MGRIMGLQLLYGYSVLFIHTDDMSYIYCFSALRSCGKSVLFTKENALYESYPPLIFMLDDYFCNRFLII